MNMNLKNLIFGGLSLMVATTIASSASALDIPLTVHETGGEARQATWTRNGVPFAVGTVPDVSVLGMNGPSGAIPSQATVLSRWMDGSVRWALMDFQADLPANGSRNYVVHTNGATASSQSVVARDEGDRIVLESGLLKIEMLRNDFRVINGAWLDRDANGSYEYEMIAPGSSAGLVLSSGGQEYTASTPDQIVIEENGPLRATVMAEGDFNLSGSNPLKMRWKLRLSAFAGSGDVEMQLTLHNPNKGSLSYGGDGSLGFDDLRVEFATALSGSRVLYGNDSGTSTQSSGHFSLHQDSSGDPDYWNKWDTEKGISYRGWKAFRNNSQVASGDRAAGWLELGGNGPSAAIGIAEFWQNFPNGIDAWDDGRIAARPFSSGKASGYTMRGGEQKTHTIHLRLADGGDPAVAMENALHRPLALASPEWYAASGSFKRFLPESDAAAFPLFDDWRAMNRATLQGGEGYRADKSAVWNRDFDDVYGWVDYGDAFADYEHEGDRANGENDLSYNMLLQMARTGDPRWFDLAGPMARHLADIDVYHTQVEGEGWEWREGGFFEHDRTGSRRHRGNYPQPNHYNAQGMFLYHYLTGDRTVIEAAMEVAENAKWRADRRSGGYSYVDSDELRSPAWMLGIVVEGWKYSQEQRFLDTSLDIIERVHPSTRCWPAGPGCTQSEIKGIYKAYINMWELGMLMVAMGEFFDELVYAGQPIPNSGIEGLQQYGEFIQNNAWRETDQIFAKIWRWSDGVTYADNGPGNILRVIDGLVAAYNHTGDSGHLNHLPEAFATSTANPWYEGSGVTYADIKMSSVVARNGNLYMEHVGDGGTTSPSCLKVVSTNPAAGESWDPLAGDFLIFFDQAVNAASAAAAISVQGSISGNLPVVTALSGPVLNLSLGSAATVDETLTIQIASTLLSAAGGQLDGNGDGNCGDSWSINLTVGGVIGPPIDTQAPDNVDDLAAYLDPETPEMVLIWSVPADDGGLAELELRGMVVPDGGTFDWDSAQVLPSPAPANPGDTQNTRVPVPNSSEGYYAVAIRSTDLAGNTSGLSNVAVDPQGPAVSFDHDSGTIREAVTDAPFEVQLFADDVSSGQGKVCAFRWRYGGESSAAARVVPLVSNPFLASRGEARLVLDLSAFSTGEVVRILVEAQDAAGNWSPTLAGFDMKMVDALELPSDCEPAAKSVFD